MSKLIQTTIIILLTAAILTGCATDREQINAPASAYYSAGDINGNGARAEMADAIMFSDYFTKGLSAFTINQQKQIAATDVNKDGKTLTLADLVFLTRLVNDKTTTIPDSDPVTVIRNEGYGSYSVSDSVQMGAAYVVVTGNHAPFYTANNMEVKYEYDGTNTHILIWSPDGNIFSGEYLSISGKMVSMELATTEGRTVELEQAEIDDQIELYPAHESAYLPIIYISFYLPAKMEGFLTITDNKEIEKFKVEGPFNAGFTNINWDLNQYNQAKLPNGIYYASLSVEGVTKTIEVTVSRFKDSFVDDIQFPAQNHTGNRGDVNLNGIKFEVADVILFSNYFVYGPLVFSVQKARQIVATDANEDGNALTIADLVYMVRVLTGDAVKPPQADTVTVRYKYQADGTVSVMDNVGIGAAFVQIKGNTDPLLLANRMNMLYAYNGTDTKVLVWSETGESFTGDFLYSYGDLLSIEMATQDGRSVRLEEYIPELFSFYISGIDLSERKITIVIALAKSFEVELSVTDESGIPVYNFQKFMNAGITEVEWDLSRYSRIRMPGGKYFCSLTAGGQTRQMEFELNR